MGQNTRRSTVIGVCAAEMVVSAAFVSLGILEEKQLISSMDRGGADLMLQLLRIDPSRRLSAHEALDHPWFWVAPKPAACSKYVHHRHRSATQERMLIRQRPTQSRVVP
jgi:serine/threonine protein kinase